jgi:hypothetical protein
MGEEMMQAGQVGSPARQAASKSESEPESATVEVCLAAAAVTVEGCWVAGTVEDYWAAATVEEYLAMVKAAESTAVAGEE